MFPTPYVLQVRRRVEAVDEWGDPVPGWGAPEPWPVHGLAPGVMDEPWAPDRERSDIAWTVYAPADGRVPTERDQVVVDGEAFQVSGRPRDFSMGPWPDDWAGVVVELTRIEG